MHYQRLSKQYKKGLQQEYRINIIYCKWRKQISTEESIIFLHLQALSGCMSTISSGTYLGCTRNVPAGVGTYHAVHGNELVCSIMYKYSPTATQPQHYIISSSTQKCKTSLSIILFLYSKALPGCMLWIVASFCQSPCTQVILNKCKSKCLWKKCIFYFFYLRQVECLK